MLRLTNIILVCLLLCSCGTMVNDLHKPTKQAAIILDRDYTTVVHADKKDDTRMLKGFRAGRYNLVGSDQDGDYYLNEHPSMLTLCGRDVDAYKSGEELPPSIVMKRQYPRTLNNGGFYIKKAGSTRTIKAFYLNELVISGIEGGIVVAAIVEAVKGSIQVTKLDHGEGLTETIDRQLSAN